MWFLTPTLTPTQANLCEQWRTTQQHKCLLFSVLRIVANSGVHRIITLLNRLSGFDSQQGRHRSFPTSRSPLRSLQGQSTVDSTAIGVWSSHPLIPSNSEAITPAVLLCTCAQWLNARYSWT